MYRIKYLKYKQKYLNLKNQKGGNNELQQIKNIYEDEIKKMFFLFRCELFLDRRHKSIIGIQNADIFDLRGGQVGGVILYSLETNLHNLIFKKEALIKFVCDKINSIDEYDALKLFTINLENIESYSSEYLLFDKYKNIIDNVYKYSILSLIKILVDFPTIPYKSYNDTTIVFAFPSHFGYFEKQPYGNIFNYFYQHPLEIIIDFDVAVGDFIIVNETYLCRVKSIEDITDNKKKIKIFPDKRIELPPKPIYGEKEFINFNNPLDNKLDEIIENEPIDIFRVKDIVEIKINSEENITCKILDITENEDKTGFVITLFDLKNNHNIIINSFYEEETLDESGIKNIKTYPFCKIINYIDGKQKKINSNFILYKEGSRIPVSIEKQYIPDFDLETRMNDIIETLDKEKEKLTVLYGEDFTKYLTDFIEYYIIYLKSIQNLIKIEIPSTLGLYFDNMSSEFINPVNYESIFYNNIYSFESLLPYKRSTETERFLLSREKKTIMIIGAGPIGLITAMLLKEQFTNCNIIIIENRGINLFRKSIYSRFQEIQFNIDILPYSIMEYLTPACIYTKKESEGGRIINIELRVIESILLYFCHKLGIIIHFEKSSYNIDNLVRNIRPILLFNASGKFNLDSEIINYTTFEKINWLDEYIRTNKCNNIIKIDDQTNIYNIRGEHPYYIKYDDIKNRYVYCDSNGIPIVKWFIYLKTSRKSPKYLSLKLSANKLFAFKNEYNMTIKIIEPYIERIRDIFRPLNVSIMTNKMNSFDDLINLINQQYNENSTEKDLFISSINDIKDYVSFSHIFSVPIYFSAISSKIIEQDDYKFLYLLIGDSHTKDFFYTGQATNKWISLLKSFITTIKRNPSIKNFIEST
jgi:hypothetical protein